MNSRKVHNGKGFSISHKSVIVEVMVVAQGLLRDASSICFLSVQRKKRRHVRSTEHRVIHLKYDISANALEIRAVQKP
jgi:hypothetical protein